ncbi:MAG: hypothetical protein AVDCRST_MAG64-24, partial [uncultured Phycisphaerae bacterium]
RHDAAGPADEPDGPGEDGHERDARLVEHQPGPDDPRRAVDRRRDHVHHGRLGRPGRERVHGHRPDGGQHLRLPRPRVQRRRRVQQPVRHGDRLAAAGL